MNNIKFFISTLPSLLIAISFHEFGHALAAYLCGDKTAKEMGRLSLNPFRHLDVFGMLSLLIFKFGWANPVPVDSSKLKNYNVGMFIVSIAGVTMNIVLAILFSVIFKYTNISSEWFNTFLVYSIIFNLNLAVFNLIPIPPLDGSNIILSFFQPHVAYEARKFNRYASLLLLVLIFSGYVSKILGGIVGPIFNFLIS